MRDLKFGGAQIVGAWLRVTDSPTMSASPANSVPNKVLATIASVKCLIVGVRAEHVIDVLRIDKNICGLVAQPQPDDVAILLHGSGQEAELIAQVIKRAPQKEVPFRSGRQLQYFVAVA
jgi:hypothetical protein